MEGIIDLPEWVKKDDRLNIDECNVLGVVHATTVENGPQKISLVYISSVVRIADSRVLKILNKLARLGFIQKVVTSRNSGNMYLTLVGKKSNKPA